METVEPVRVNDETMFLVALKLAVLEFDRQPILAGEGGGVGDAGQLALQLRDFALHLGFVDARLLCRHQLALDLIDDVDGAVHGRVGHIDQAGAETERILDGGE